MTVAISMKAIEQINRLFMYTFLGLTVAMLIVKSAKNIQLTKKVLKFQNRFLWEISLSIN